MILVWVKTLYINLHSTSLKDLRSHIGHSSAAPIYSDTKMPSGYLGPGVGRATQPRDQRELLRVTENFLCLEWTDSDTHLFLC